ncbi:MAG: hypothetical protein WC071_13630, partial [Victivallaceae bacterium]
MRILLISTNFSIDPYAVFPLGLGVIARTLREKKHEVKLLDLLASGENDIALRKAIADFDPQLVGVGIRNIDNVNSLEPVFFLDDAARTVQLVRNITSA